MTKLLTLGLAAAALTAAMPAQATEFVFNTTTAGDNYRYTATSGGETLRMSVSAYNRNMDGSIGQATIQSFAHGLGIIQPVEGGAGAYHQIDNVSGWEFLVLQFDRAVSLTGSQVNAFQLSGKDYLDADQFVAWGNVSGNVLNSGVRNWNDAIGALSGRTNIDTNPVYNRGQDYGTVNTKFNLTNASGNVWLIGAAMGDMARNPDGRNDAFKLAGLTVTAVPEPATWAMMLTGFAMVGAAARYRRRKTTAAIA